MTDNSHRHDHAVRALHELMISPAFAKLRKSKAGQAFAERFMAELPTGAGSAVPRYVALVELFWSSRKILPPEALKAGAQLARFVGHPVNNFGGQADRWNAIAMALLRDAGEPAPAGHAWPKPADDPAIAE